MMSIPDGTLLGLDTKWLFNTDFRDFLFPGLIIFLFIGFPSLSALYANIINHSKRFAWSVFTGISLSIVSIIQGLYVTELFWINTLMLLLGLMIVAVSFQLRGKTMI
jgi:peptidoglycan biosynthesis protein MviN/MurJ (putative lipid II flippase)